MQKIVSAVILTRTRTALKRALSLVPTIKSTVTRPEITAAGRLNTPPPNEDPRRATQE